jgi:hypothetical protein
VSGIEQLADPPSGIDWDELVAQPVVGGVEGDGQSHGQALGGEPADQGNQTNRGDGDGAGGQSEALGDGVDEPVQGGDDIPVVDQRFAHAHEDDIAQPRRGASQRPRGRRPGGVTHLLDDLGGRQVARQPHLTGGAEGAGHAAAGLGGHAQGRAIPVAHEDGLHPHPVVQLPQVLDGTAAVGPQGAHLVDEVGQQLGRQPVALAGRQVRHIGGVAGEAGEVVARELVGAEGG